MLFCIYGTDFSILPTLTRRINPERAHPIIVVAVVVVDIAPGGNNANIQHIPYNFVLSFLSLVLHAIVMYFISFISPDQYCVLFQDNKSNSFDNSM